MERYIVEENLDEDTYDENSFCVVDTVTGDEVYVGFCADCEEYAWEHNHKE